MADSSTRRTTSEKIALFRSCFFGLPHVCGTYDPRTGQATPLPHAAHPSKSKAASP